MTAAVATETNALWFMDALLRIHISTDDAEDYLSVIEMTVPEGSMPPLHLQDEDESFYVLDGVATLYVGEQVVTLMPGASHLAPRGIPHTYRAESDLRLLVVTEGAFERFLRTVGRPAETLTPPPPAEGRLDPEDIDFITRVAVENGIDFLGPPGMLPSEL